MSVLLNMFQRPSVHQSQFVIDTKVEVEDWGNIEALRAGITDPAKIAEFMEKLKRERMGLPGPETDEDGQ